MTRRARHVRHDVDGSVAGLKHFMRSTRRRFFRIRLTCNDSGRLLHMARRLRYRIQKSKGSMRVMRLRCHLANRPGGGQFNEVKSTSGQCGRIDPQHDRHRKRLPDPGGRFRTRAVTRTVRGRAASCRRRLSGCHGWLRLRSSDRSDAAHHDRTFPQSSDSVAWHVCHAARRHCAAREPWPGLP